MKLFERWAYMEHTQWLFIDDHYVEITAKKETWFNGKTKAPGHMSVPHHIWTNTKNITEWKRGQCHAYDGYLLTSNRLGIG